MFSTAGATAHMGMPGASWAAVAMAWMTVAAPVLSVFISPMLAGGLRLMPPVSKVTPLPTRASSRPRASRSRDGSERRAMKRGWLDDPRPTAMNMPMPMVGGFLRADDLEPHAELAGHVAGLVGEDLGADVIGRPLRQPPRTVAAVADDLAPLGAQQQVVRIARLDGEGAFVEGRRQAIVRVAVDGGRLRRTLHEAARDELHDRRLQRSTTIDEQVRDVHGQAPDVTADQAAHDDGPQPARPQPVDAPAVADADGQHEAHAHVHRRDEPRLPERCP